MSKSKKPTSLEIGTKKELEHKDTIKKIKNNPDMSIEEIAKMIAQDHLDEAPNYYMLLEKMEREMKKNKN